MNIFLKWYYWYKNLWDEILFFWVVKRLFDNYKIENLYVEVDNVDRFNNWLKSNENLIKPNDGKIKSVPKNPNLKSLNVDFIVFWWGEVLADQRPFPYNGWNYLIKYYNYIKEWKFILMWWIGTPKKIFSKFLYKFLLSKAQKVVVREKKSYSICLDYTQKVILYRDFAQDTIEYYFRSFDDVQVQDLMLINLNSYINTNEAVDFINVCVSKFPGFKKVFVPFDIDNDSKQYQVLKNKIPDLEYFDWTKHTLEDTLKLFKQAKAWVGARLHFLLTLYWMKKQLFPLFYQEKINKFFDANIKL